VTIATVDVYVLDTTPQQNPVSGVNVRVLSSDGTTFIAQATTNNNGLASFDLPDSTTYQLRMYQFQVGFTNPQLIVVEPAPANNTFQVAAQLLMPPVPLDSRLCTAYGYFRDVTGAPQAYVEAHFIAKFDPVWLDGNAVLSERVVAWSDATGYMQLNLIRNGHFDVTIQGEEDVVRHIKVPDAPNVNLADLIFPIVSLVELDPPGPYTMTAGTQLNVGLTVYASDGEDLGLGGGQIRFLSSDPNVLSWNINNAGLVLVAMGPGTATLTITRCDQSIIHIPDPGITNGVLSVTVNP
jgi:hypothetical protein